MIDIEPEERNQQLASRLISWATNRGENYPWRETTDPYKILVAEILLRKTTRSQVEKVFRQFIRRFPTVDALSKGRLSEIKKIIAPLGLERVRALGLSRLARILVARYEGRVPHDRDSLLALPNVGRYTANALLCLAYNEQVPLVDTNAIRVVTRVFSITPHRSRPYTDPDLWATVASLIPHGHARRFNLAILDLGYSLCLRNSPKCLECPLLELCDFGGGRTQPLNASRNPLMR